jgi:hypothetical protein
MAAADGVIEVTFDWRTGLTSCEFFRERMLLEPAEAEVLLEVTNGAGDESREDLGDCIALGDGAGGGFALEKDGGRAGCGAVMSRLEWRAHTSS